MKKKCIFLLVSCFLLLSPLTINANHTTSIGRAAVLPPCDLPAPTNLQYHQPTPYSVTFTWDPVQGASGYRGILLNLTNGDTESADFSTALFTYPVHPGDEYMFVVAAMCSEEDPPSSNTSQITLRAATIIIDLIAYMPGCIPSDLVSDDIPNNGDIWDHNWTNPIGAQYFIELTKKEEGLPEVKVRLAFKYKASNNHFELQGMTTNPSGTQICGVTTSGICQEAPVGPGQSVEAYNSKVTYGGRTCRISFPNLTQVNYYTLINYEEVPFNTFKIYSTCGSGPGTISGGGGRSDSETGEPDIAPDENATPKMAAANPFSNHLTLYFPHAPLSPVKTRLLDLRGHLWAEALVQPDQLNGNAYTINTAALPAGMYFLQLETQPGQFVTRKVTKI